MKIWILSNGCYSDTHTAGVFSTLEAAEMAARIFTDDARIEEWDVDHEVEQMKRGSVPWFVRLNRNTGSTMECEQRNSSYGAWTPDVGEDINKNLFTCAWATNSLEAIKIASERRRAFLALPEVSPADDAVAKAD